MAKRKTKGRASAPATTTTPSSTRMPRATPPEAAPPIVTPVVAAPPSAYAGPRVPLALAALVVLLALGLPTPATHRFPALVEAARVLAGLCALLLAAPHHPRLSRWKTPLTLTGLVAATLALGALLGRHPYAFRAFPDAHAAFLGVPTELAALLVVLGARHRDRPAGRVLLAIGAVWALAALAFPEAALSVRAPWALAGLATVGAPSLLAFLVLVATGGIVAVQTIRGQPGFGVRDGPAPGLRETIRNRPLPRFVGPILRHGVLGFAAALLLVGLTTADTLPVAALAATLVALLGTAADHLLADRRPEAVPTPRTARTLDFALLAGILAVWFLLKSQALIASNTDENIYFYMAKLLGDGKLPYVDYFFAHPPLHALIPGTLFAVFGYSLTLAKLVPLVACGLTGLSLWALARRHLGRLAAPLALVFFLFAAEVLKASSNLTGVNLTTLFIVVGVTQHLAGRPLRAGLALGAAASTGFYAIAAVCALMALGLFRWPASTVPATPNATRWSVRLRFGLWQIAGFTFIFGFLNILFYALAGDRFLEGVYSYHTAKFFQDPNMVELFKGPIAFPGSLFHNLGALVSGSAFQKELFYHPHLWLAGLALPAVATVAWLARPRGQRGLLRFLAPTRLHRDGADGAAATVWLVALALFFQFAMFRELYSFYFALIYPLLALALAYVLVRITQLFAAAIAERRRWLAALALGLIAIPAWSDRLAASRQVVFDDELEQLGARNDYIWEPGPVGPALSDVVRNLFWEDYRLRGDVEAGFRHYLWTKKRAFETLGAIGAYVKTHSAPTETIAGASTLAPLIALEADRRIAADEIDTNNKRFKIGRRDAESAPDAAAPGAGADGVNTKGPAYALDEAAYWTSLCHDNIRFVVSAPRSYFTTQRMESLATARRWFRKAQTFNDDGLSYRGTFPIVLYERIDDPTVGPRLEPGTVCRWEGP